MAKIKTVDELIVDILPLRDEIKPWILKSGIKESVFDRKFTRLEKMTPRQIRLFLTWILKLRGLTFELKRVWNLLPESTWRLYEQSGEEELREVELLHDAKQNIKETWYSRRS